jgi:hypothetical protein
VLDLFVFSTPCLVSVIKYREIFEHAETINSRPGRASQGANGISMALNAPKKVNQCRLLSFFGGKSTTVMPRFNKCIIRHVKYQHKKIPLERERKSDAAISMWLKWLQLCTLR